MEDKNEDSEENSKEDNNEVSEDDESSVKDEAEEKEEQLEVDNSPVIEWETKKGEKFTASEQELKNAYCLYEENKKRMTELSEEKKELENDLTIAHRTVQFKEKIEKLEGDDLLIAVLDQAQAMNPKVEKALESFYGKVFDEAAKVAQVTPEQRQAYDQQKKLEYYEQQEKQREKQQTVQKEEQYKASERERIKEQWSVDDALISEANSVAVNKGLIDETTPLNRSVEVVEAIIKDYVFENRAKEVLNTVNPDLVEDISTLDDLVEWQFRNPKAG